MISTQRMGQQFKELVEIDSLSRQERDVAKKIETILTAKGATVYYDDAKDKVGGNCSNLVAKFNGSVDTDPIFLCGHMDTVGPGKNIKVQYNNGIFTSDGTTILGSDDKSAIAIILEVLDVILENQLDHPPIEIVFTVCEEIGLLGAKHFDYSLLNSKFGYILDAADTTGIVNRAPAANDINIKVHGRAAHAGVAPENGINAFSVASRAIAQLELGRMDAETTCNLGVIKGGVASNIVPAFVEIEGEARSHDESKLQAVTDTIVNAFEDAVQSYRQAVNDGSGLPRLEMTVETDFTSTHIPEDHIAIALAKKAAQNIGMNLETKTTGGGADANIFFQHGIYAGVLGTGMTDVHTVNESINIKDMENTAQLILEILKLHSSGEVN